MPFISQSGEEAESPSDTHSGVSRAQILALVSNWLCDRRSQSRGFPICKMERVVVKVKRADLCNTEPGLWPSGKP